MKAYDEFLAAKLAHDAPRGLDRLPTLPSALFPFQRAAVEWALSTGRCALFEDCGLGKTLQQLAWAHAVHEATGRPVLILAPLGVAHQTVREGERFGLPVTYTRDPAELRDVTITNYEMAKRFSADKLGGIVLDESSILKSYMGATKRFLVSAFEHVPYRLACTATPAPNDTMELGNHSEFLGILPSHDMLARWFLNDYESGHYRLKGHAVQAFWDWVTTWARAIGRPSDLGPFSDAGYVMPPLEHHVLPVEVDVTTSRVDAAGRDGQVPLVRMGNSSATAIHREKRISAAARARRVAEIVASEQGEPALIWADTDYEAEALRAVLPDVVEVHGKMKDEDKERALLGFSDGSIRWLMTKPKIGGFGLNWQHCARVLYLGPTYSYESYYQSVRRCYRFGQNRAVQVYVAMGNNEVEIWNAMLSKASEHERMKLEMYAAMSRALGVAVARWDAYEPRHEAPLPLWL